MGLDGNDQKVLMRTGNIGHVKSLGIRVAFWQYIPGEMCGLWWPMALEAVGDQQRNPKSVPDFLCMLAIIHIT